MREAIGYQTNPGRRDGGQGPLAVRRGERGQALVELALLFPVFLLLLLGAAEFGRLAYAAIEVSNAARAGAAYAAQSRVTASDSATANIQQAAIQDAPNLTGVTATVAHSCTCSDGTPITCATALDDCVAPALIMEFVQVNTSGTIDPLFHLPGLPTTFTLHGQAIMAVQQ